jgi:hypothetical protein
MVVLVRIDGPDCGRHILDSSRHQGWVMPMHITHRWAAFTRMKFALLVLALELAGPASVAAQVKGAWHPMVFSMMESWISDVASPVVAEINLDAVQRNRNQFDYDAVKQEGAWVVYPVPEGGFQVHRLVTLGHRHHHQSAGTVSPVRTARPSGDCWPTTAPIEWSSSELSHCHHHCRVGDGATRVSAAQGRQAAVVEGHQPGQALSSRWICASPPARACCFACCRASMC